jgi:ribA/ribD-fused uncharacterized protein
MSNLPPHVLAAIRAGGKAIAPKFPEPSAPKNLTPKRAQLPVFSRSELESQGAILGFTGSNRYLSNFWFCNLRDGGVVYPTVEHAFMANKVDFEACGPERTAELVSRILSAPTPADARRLGRKVPLRPDWEEVKFSIMEELVFRKFQDSALSRKNLLATGDRPIMETNSWGDRVWGVTPVPGNSDGLTGLNHLGQILMKVRGMLRDSEG